jgi:Copper type II ascorbate-dependent monooxygenase, C-terminal domain
LRVFLYVFQSFDNPIELQPGDEIRVDCTYQTIGVNTTTYYGEGTSDEMCYGFITYYPANDNFTYCGQWRTVNECTNRQLQCDIDTFQLLGPLMTSLCQPNNCSSSCKLVMMLAEETGCTSGDIGQFLLLIDPQRMSYVFGLMNLCGISTNVTPTTTATPNTSDAISGETSTMKTQSTIIYSVTILLASVAVRM